MANFGEKKIKICYFYKNLLISFVFFSLFVCKPLRQTLSIIDYATIHLTHQFPSHSVGVGVGALNFPSFLGVKRKDLDAYIKAISSGAT